MIHILYMPTSAATVSSSNDYQKQTGAGGKSGHSPSLFLINNALDSCKVLYS